MSSVELSSFECIEMAVFDASTLSPGVFVPLNTSVNQPINGANGFSDDIKILKVYNDGSEGVTFSFDGVVPHDYLPSKGTMIIDLQANHFDASAYGSGMKYGRKGQLVYGYGTASTAGLNIYISGYR